jgi:nucleoside-diphosphate-sugar epimerase
MKVFLVGATGAIGKPLVPQLQDAGHEVVGTTRSQAKAGELRAAGAEPVVVDPHDAAALTAAVVDARPDAVIHELTALRGLSSMRNFDKVFAETNRLRTEATDVLIAAAQEAGASRFIAQSFAGWPYAKTNGAIKTEDEPLDPDPPTHMSQSLEAIRHLEQATVDAGGLALRYGGFYGPGTPLTAGGEIVDLIRKRRFPVVGNGNGLWSFVHIDDAAAATVLALEHGSPGVYNIVDDEPSPAHDWLPALARIAGAKPPRHMPVWLGRVAAGDAIVSMMTEARGASNAKAKRELGWAPRHASWRQGFAQELEAAA